VKPRAIAINHRSEIFIVDRSGSIQKFDPEGNRLLGWELEKTDLGYPTGLGCDPEGDLWVADTHNARVLHYSEIGELLGSFGGEGEEPGQFIFPTDVLVGDDGFVYVANYGEAGRDRIMKFRRDGTFVLEWGDTGTGTGEFQRVMGLCFDREGTIWAADSCNHRLQGFTTDGEHVATIGENGGERACFSYPYDVALDGDGNLLVAEFDGHCIQRVTTSGRSLERWGRPGRNPGEFDHPWGVAVLRGRVYVVDAQNHRIQVFGA
jgi:DNA-binding beta-propeller fold protein YncE